tara:strand:+ start:734 stop:1741 length:1008 start_codon:yes stop_codon:yes gene_type:complete
MPLKNGELSGPEIRVLIRGHNKMSQIKVPPGLDRDGLIKFLKSKKYTVDHKNKRLVDTTTGRITTLSTAKTITKPKPKTDEQKAATKAKKDMKAKVTKDKEDAIKAEGVKQGAALQKVVSKRVKAKALAKEDEVRPKEKVGKVKFDPKKVKVIGVKGSTKPKKKEDAAEKKSGGGSGFPTVEELMIERVNSLNTVEDLGKEIDLTKEAIRDIATEKKKTGKGGGGVKGQGWRTAQNNAELDKKKKLFKKELDLLIAKRLGIKAKIREEKKGGSSEEDKIKAKINQLKKNVNEQKFDLTIETRREMAKYFSYNSKKDTTSDGMPGVPYWKLKPKFK